MSLDNLLDLYSEPNTEAKTDTGKVFLTAYEKAKRRQAKAHQEIAKNIRLSSELRVEINKKMKGGAALEDVLKDCFKCISLMTGDTVFYEQNSGLLNR